MSEIRMTDPVTGGMKGSKLEQLSLVDPGFKDWAISEWPQGEPRTRVAHHLLNFEEGNNVAIYEVVIAAQDLLVDCCGGSRTKGVIELARQYGYGSRKYDRGNWRKGYAWSLSIDALWRHLIFPFSVDEESGNLHAAAVLWHACCLRDFVQLGLGTDDRLYKRPAEARANPTSPLTPAGEAREIPEECEDCEDKLACFAEAIFLQSEHAPQDRVFLVGPDAVIAPKYSGVVGL